MVDRKGAKSVTGKRMTGRKEDKTANGKKFSSKKGDNYKSSDYNGKIGLYRSNYPSILNYLTLF